MNAPRIFDFAAVSAGIGLAASLACAGNIEVIYSKIPGHESSIVPGAKDLNGNPAVTEFRALHALEGSPDGSHWLIWARTQQGSDLETIFMHGSGSDGSGFAQRGQPVHDGEPGEVYDFFPSGVGAFNELNDFVFTARAKDGVPGQLQKVIRVTGGVPEIVLQQGDLYVGLLTSGGAPAPDAAVGNSVGSAHLLNDGTFGLLDPTIQNVHSSFRPAMFFTNIAFAQSNVTGFTGIDGKSHEIWETMTLNRFRSTPDFSPISLGGSGSWVAQGRRVGQSFGETVLVLNDHAVMETGVQIPGSPIVVDSIFETRLIANGDWYVRGDTAEGRRWGARNGEVMIRTDDFVPGTTERWADSISAFTGNMNGDWVAIGRTNNPDAALNEVIVFNGEVVVRKGDPIDLSGNGQFDDDVYIGRGNPANAAFSGDVFLSNDRVLYFFANLIDGEGNEYHTLPQFGQPTAFLRLDLGEAEPCVGDLTGDGVVDVSDLLILLGAWGDCPSPPSDCPADLNGDGVVDVSDLLILLGAWGPCP